jgi:basic membrane protein A
MPRTRWFVILIALALALTACSDDSGSDTTSASGGDSDATEEGPTFIYMPPTPIGGNTFLQLGELGTQAAAEQFGGTALTFESSDVTSRRANLEAAIEESPAVIVLNTFDFTDLGFEYATANPDQEFILIDACPDAPPANLHCGVFREYETAYLLGIEAGMLTEKNSVGSVVALDIPFLHRYSDSFALGAQSVSSDISDSQVFIGGDSPFTDPAKAKEQALALAAQNLDHIFAVGAGSNPGVFEAAVEQGFFTYGVDVNECPKAPGQIVDNIEKRVENVVVQMIEKVLDGTAGAFESFGLAEDGMSPTSLTDEGPDSGCVVMDHPDIIEAIKEAKQQIIDGTLVIPDPLDG